MYRMFACPVPLMLAISSGHSAPKLKDETNPYFFPTEVGSKRVLVVRSAGLKYESQETVEAIE